MMILCKIGVFTCEIANGELNSPSQPNFYYFYLAGTTPLHMALALAMETLLPMPNSTASRIVNGIWKGTWAGCLVAVNPPPATAVTLKVKSSGK